MDICKLIISLIKIFNNEKLCPKKKIVSSSLLFSSLLFSSLTLKAQDPTMFDIEVCRVMATTPDTECTDPEPGCFRYHYEFYLIPNNGYTGFFPADELIISARLTVNGTVIATNPSPDLISRFSPDDTDNCYNPLFNGILLPTEEEISFILSNDDNDPSNDPDPVIKIQANGQPFYLFTAVVDAYPGETIDVDVDASYSSGSLIGEEMTAFQACGLNNYFPTGVTFPAPPACSGSVNCLKLGPYTGGGDEPALIPVRGPNSSYDEIDMLIDVSFDNLMEMPEIIGGNIPASAVEVFVNQSGGYSIYVHARNLPQNSFLFTIKLNGPMFLSSGGTAVLSFVQARYESGGLCCSPCFEPDETVVFTGFADCVDDISINIDGVTEQGCSELGILVTLDWTGPPDDKDFYKFNVVLDLDLQGDISIAGIINDNIGCPSSGASYCGGSTCFEILDANTIRYCFRTFTDPQTVFTDTGFRIKLDADGGCVNGVTVREAYLSEINGGLNVACVPETSVDQGAFPLCSPMLSGMITKEDDEPLKTYDVSVTSVACDYDLFVNNCDANYAQCVCTPKKDYTVIPEKDGGDLNGVTTYDLVLISRHVLGTQFLDSPYKIIAADANGSNSVTTFDIVEIRKLILAIKPDFDPVPSWRFVPKSYVFPVPTNPFMPMFPESAQILQNSIPISNINFIAIKVGDVNLSADAGNCFAPPGAAEDRGMAEVAWETDVPGAMKSGEVVTLPFSLAAGMPMPAFQAGIGFDTEQLAFIGAAKGDLELLNQSNFGLTETDRGRVRMLWLSPDQSLWQLPQKGDVLFYLSFQAKKDIADAGAMVWLDDAILANRSFAGDGTESKLVLQAVQTNKTLQEKPLQARFYPNPFADAPVIEVTASSSGRATLWLFDAFGARLAYRKVELAEGANTFKLEEVPDLPKGVYIWKVKSSFGKVSGVAVKQ